MVLRNPERSHRTNSRCEVPLVWQQSTNPIAECPHVGTNALAPQLQTAHGTPVASKQLASDSLVFLSQIAFAFVLASSLSSCGNSSTGMPDGAVAGDVVEYGVRGRPPNNRYCAELAASPTAVARTSSNGVHLCNWDAPAGTPCGGGNCEPMTLTSDDFADYLRNNRVPQMCSLVPGTGPFEECDTPRPGGCGDGTFCVTVRPLAFAGTRRLCVPYPCNP